MTLGAPCPTSEPAPCGEVLSPQDLGGGSDTPFSGCQTVCNETWQSQLGALKQPVDIQMVAYRFPRVSPPATHTPDAGSPAQTPQLQGVGVQTPVCTWGCETAPSHSPPLPPSPACITWSQSRLGRRPEGPGRRGPQGLSPQVRKKVIARAPLCSQGRDGSEVQPTPLKPRPPWSRTGALSAFQMCTHLPASHFTQPPLWSSQHVHCALVPERWGQTRRSSDQHCPGATFIPSWATGSGHLGSQEPLWVSFTNRPGRRGGRTLESHDTQS